MSKNLLAGATLAVIILTAYFTLAANSNFSRTNPKNAVGTAVNQGKLLYQTEKGRNRDFSSGPCLSNALMPGWVLDIVHNPRQPVDDLAENQCSAYREGKAEHFVELDTEGNLIRTQ